MSKVQLHLRPQEFSELLEKWAELSFWDVDHVNTDRFIGWVRSRWPNTLKYATEAEIVVERGR